MRLLRTPPPKKDESLVGYIIRLTEANGYDYPKWILQNAGWKIDLNNGGWIRIINSYVKYDKFYEISGRTSIEEKQIIKNIAFYPDFIILNRFLYCESSKFCPACLREADYYRKNWDYYFINICPKHRIYLVDLCPSCNQKIKWNRSSVSTCSCGYDIKLFEGEVYCYPSDFCNIVKRKMDLPPRSDLSQNKNPLNKLLQEKFWNFIFLQADFLARKRNGVKIRFLENKKMFQCLQEVYQAFDDFPSNVCLLFNSILLNSGKAFCNEYISSTSSFCIKENLLFILLALNEYLKQPSSAKIIIDVFELEKELLTFDETAERLKLTYTELFKLEIRNVFPKVYLEKVSDRPYFLSKDVESLQEHMSKFILLDKVLELTKLSHRELLQISEFGFISPAEDALMSLFDIEVYEENQITELIEKIRTKISKSKSIKDEISSSDVLEILSKYNENLGLFLITVLAGIIKPIRENRRSGLFRFSFSRKDILNYVNQGLIEKAEAKIKQNKKFRTKIPMIAKFLEKKLENEIDDLPAKSTELENPENEAYFDLQDLVWVACRLFRKNYFNEENDAFYNQF